MVKREGGIYFPNIFSPNGDGINDIASFQTRENVQSIKSLEIYDRWGSLVHQQFNFTPNEPSNGWDGTNHGKILNPGVFVWITKMEFEDGNVKTFSGEITLLR